MDAVKIGAAIRALRIQAGYTQRGLADCLNVTDKAVSKWERGLSIPDVSIIAKLSLLLNCDVDNLLEGNITYLEKSWQGLLLLKECQDIFAGSMAYGKPLVYFYLSYFMLAGIGDIYILSRKRSGVYRKNHRKWRTVRHPIEISCGRMDTSGRCKYDGCLGSSFYIWPESDKIFSACNVTIRRNIAAYHR